LTGARLLADRLCVDLGGRRVLDEVSIIAEPGHVVGVVGPNGCGKSTLLRALLRLLRPAAGTVTIDGVDIASLSTKSFARTAAAVLQDSLGDFDLRVRDVVAMGRTPYKRIFEGDKDSDIDVIAESLALVNASHLIDRPIALMSGGERQRVLVARALAQQPSLLVMDEPTNHLDVRHQFDILALPNRLGITAVIALHDLNLAAHYCDIITVLHNGTQMATGAPDAVLTAELMAKVYEVTAKVGFHSETGRPQVSYDPTPPNRTDRTSPERRTGSGPSGRHPHSRP
jgi:iron complex transport system ATP-binding protein